MDFMFSKGCFRRCEFCVAGGQEGNHVSSWAIDRVEEQLRLFAANGIAELIIQDDAFIYKTDELLDERLDLHEEARFPLAEQWRD